MYYDFEENNIKYLCTNIISFVHNEKIISKCGVESSDLLSLHNTYTINLFK